MSTIRKKQDLLDLIDVQVKQLEGVKSKEEVLWTNVYFKERNKIIQRFASAIKKTDPIRQVWSNLFLVRVKFFFRWGCGFHHIPSDRRITCTNFLDEKLFAISRKARDPKPPVSRAKAFRYLNFLDELKAIIERKRDMDIAEILFTMQGF